MRAHAWSPNLMRSSARRRTSHVKRTARLGGATRRWRFCATGASEEPSSHGSLSTEPHSGVRVHRVRGDNNLYPSPAAVFVLVAGTARPSALALSAVRKEQVENWISCIADSGRASNCSSTNSTPPTSRATHDHWPNKLPNHDQHWGHYNLRYFRRSEPNRAPIRGGRPGGSEDYQTSNASKADVALSLDERSIPGRCVASRLAPAA